MTGDETNKCICGSNQHHGQDFLCALKYSQDPVASNTGKDNIPWEHDPAHVCRFCGGDIRYHQYEDFAECKEKEIGELQVKIASLESSLEGMKKRNIELEAFAKALDEVSEGKQDALEHANVVAGETFEALKESQAEQVKSFDKIEELAAKLKTAEDKLAKVTKEKEEIRRALNRESL